MSRFRTWVVRLRNAWAMFGIALCLLLVIETSCRLACAVRDSTSDRLPYRTIYREADAGAPWMSDYWREFEACKTQWEPYVYWRRKPCQGRFINVDSRGIRRTWNQAREDSQQPFCIFMFGGSTMWGTGARDDYTIPSWVAKCMEKTGAAVEITNFGESGYVSKQELIALIGELESGNVPDLVVFYDGMNDAYSAFQNGESGIPQNEANRRLEFQSNRRIGAIGDALRWLFPGTLRISASIACRLSGRPAGVNTREADLGQDAIRVRLADDVVRHYGAILDTAGKLGQGYGFSVLFYWQPTVFQKQHQSAVEAAAAEELAEFGKFVEVVQNRIQSDVVLAANSSFRDLSDIFAQETDPLFIDCHHLGEAGNKMVARHIAKDVGDVLAATESTRREK